MIVYDEAVPVHPLAEGVTVIVDTTGAVPVFEAVKEGVFPVPLAARPILALLFVQLKVVPAVVLVKLDAETVPPVQIAVLAGTVTAGLGFTVMV